MDNDDFEWDDAKATQNLASHGVSFEAARLAFDDAFAIARDDRRQNYGEDRYTLLAWPRTAYLLSLTRFVARG
jgi:uncharacterized DUF497 family protein